MHMQKTSHFFLRNKVVKVSNRDVEAINFPPEIKEICEELGIHEEELQPRDLESFREARLTNEMAKLRYERYETKRKGNKKSRN